MRETSERERSVFAGRLWCLSVAVFIFRPRVKLERKAADAELVFTVQRVGRGNRRGFMAVGSSL